MKYQLVYTQSGHVAGTFSTKAKAKKWVVDNMGPSFRSYKIVLAKKNPSILKPKRGKWIKVSAVKFLKDRTLLRT